MLMLGERIMKFRRDRWRDQVISNGKSLRELEVEQAHLAAADITDPLLDALIDRKRERHTRLLTKIKETA